MADIFDYMLWRGDLPFERDPLNDIDNLILSRAAYLPLDGIAPASFVESLPLGQAVAAFLERGNAAELVCMETDLRFCRALMDCPRFAALPVRGYENMVDKELEKQFCAMAFSLGENEHLIAFRGTDNTIVGWREDFNMTFITPVPSQLEAARYLESAARALKGELICAGHSKGGNLAVYASAFASPETQGRIKEIYSNDGPGFESSVLLTDGYLAISERIRSFVPQSSVVGMLLSHEEDYTIVKSSQMSVWQHDLYSWELLGREFVCLDKVTSSSRFIDRTLKDWLSGLTAIQREKFIDGIFSLLVNTNAVTFNQLNASKLSTLKTIVKTAAGLSEETRAQVLYALGLLFRSAKGNLGEVFPKLPAKKAENP